MSTTTYGSIVDGVIPVACMLCATVIGMGYFLIHAV